MAEFSKETQDFLSSVGGERKRVLTMIPPSADRMTPGEVLIFRYNPIEGTSYRTDRGFFATNQKVALIVRCKRGDGVFPGKSGKLVSCFKLNGDSDTVVDAVIENLYKKRRVASYYGKIKQSLIKLLGVHSYRTYKLGSMREIYKVNLGK